MSDEKTFFMIKPDGVQRGLIGKVIGRIEEKGMKIAAMKLIRIDRVLAKAHYGEHKGKGFFEGLLKYIQSGPVVAMVIEGKEAISVVRAIAGATDPKSAPFGTIRGDFGMDVGRNIVHSSDGTASAEREIGLFFSEKETLDYSKVLDDWIYE